MLKYEGTDKIRDIKYEDGYVDRIYYDNNTLLVFTSDKEKTGVDEVLFKGRKLVDVTSYGKCEQNGTPTPDNPVDIVCNNGVLKIRHQSGLPLGYTLLDYIESTGTQWIDTGVKMNASHIIYSDGFERSGNHGQLVHGYVDNNNRLGATIYGGTSKNVAYYWVLGGTGKKRYQDPNIITNNINVNARFQMTQGSSGITFTQGNNTYQVENYGGITSGIGAKNWYIFKTEATGQGMTMGVLYNAKIMQGTAILHNYVPCYRKSDNVIGVYDLISGQFFTNQGTGDFTAGSPVSDPVEIYTDGTVETIEDTIGNTATAEMLLKVGDYKDTQDILTGTITRNVKAIVLKGTENWSAMAYGNTYTANILSNKLVGNTRGVCSHYPWINRYVNLSGVDYGYLAPGSTTLAIKNKDCVDVTAFKTWLADQYNAGTPVIVVYPLATPITEQVLGQQLTIQQGNNTIEITQASIDDILLKVKYK